uniref:Uncharacterized protein AlNc14C13G1590 n=1 Tax=Albugo laibachii Nc14 TaxID=890382 RepID=F0W3M9_9STRA|nr:conserved hypothetical protein [Albugo laibachii Nc14]CCA16264.1 conserved hypothetical protein [Albugo laibachii Nc14]|eukprot:CCA16264.1 conserved hypothetical protein [Albugo laibachii Nc14]
MRSSSRPRYHSRSRDRRDHRDSRRWRRSRSRSGSHSSTRRKHSPSVSVSRTSRHRPSSTRYTERQYGKDWDDTKLFEERKRKRESLQFSIWSTIPSPSPPKQQNDGKKSSLPRKRRSISLTSASSITSEDDLKHKKERKVSHKRVRESKASKKRKSKKSDRESRSKLKWKKGKKKSSKKKHKVEYRSPSSDNTESGKESPQVDGFEVEKFKRSVQNARESDGEHQIVGPQPLQESTEASGNSLSYGKALLPGEGAAIAQFVQKNMRIPRRGEVGWNGPEIEQLEDLGYVMSGSRHKKMNAVRIRKENQVYTAEEKRALQLINFEEKQQREHTIMHQFRDMLTERLTKKHGAQVFENAENCKI